ncbi:MAG: Imm63 family immunity protein, partial [Alphaproteobacteria bacterium]
REDGLPHIEVGDAYFYVISERGHEFKRRATTDLDELLYWVLRDFVFSVAVDFEVRHRRMGQDSRRLMFAKEMELMSLISSEWATRLEGEHKDILVQHPFNDLDADL